MRTRALLTPRLAVLLGAALLGGGASAETPRLGVLVIFDQLRPGDIDAYAPSYGPGGFGGLMARSTARFDARYRYAVTETGPGHATLATGTNPPGHGICANRWKDDAGATVYCVEDPAHPVFGRVGTEGAAPPGVSAKNLRAPTLGDSLKLGSAGRSRVVTLALKDRSAVLTGGASADLAIWYDEELGAFTTSTAYVAEVPGWLADAGAALPAKSRAEGRWSPLPDPPKAKWVLPADDRPGESLRYGFDTTFPHDLSALEGEKDKRLAYRTTPQSMSDLVSLAVLAVDEEQLGVDDVPDLLVIGLSTTDFAGHYYGPDSLEMADLIRRADLELRRLVKELDRRLGATGFVLAVAADHGATPLPESFAAAGMPSGRIDVVAVDTQMKAAAREVLGSDVPAPHLHPPHVFLPLGGVSAEKRPALLDRLERVLRDVPAVAHVYRHDTLADDLDPYATQYQESTAEGRCGVMMVRAQPGYVFAWNAPTGTDHGTPYAWDTTIPLFISGPGVRRGRYAEIADPRDVAPTLAFLLGAAAPGMSQRPPLPAVGGGTLLPVLTR